VSGINIGPVHKKDIMRSATMLEKAKELACILCFDVPVDKDAEKMAEEMGIRLFKGDMFSSPVYMCAQFLSADIIYHLFDAFTAYNAEIVEAKRKDAAPSAVWPCRLKIIAAFCKRDPIILGVDILDGTLRVGTPLCVVKVDPDNTQEGNYRPRKDVCFTMCRFMTMTDHKCHKAHLWKSIIRLMMQVLQTRVLNSSNIIPFIRLSRNHKRVVVWRSKLSTRFISRLRCLGDTLTTKTKYSAMSPERVSTSSK
jgi:hypothetical protein